MGRLVGFETTARPGSCVTYRKHIAANASVAVFAIAHCPGLPWILEYKLERRSRFGDNPEGAMENFRMNGPTLDVSQGAYARFRRRAEQSW
jgi:hypothetical protein